MPGLRFTYLLALVAWLGGLFVLGGIAAPVVFDVLQARLPADGRILAGAVFGELLARFHLVSYACGAAMVVTLVVMALIGPRPRPFAPRLAVIAMMIGVTVGVAVPIGHRIRDLQAGVNGPIAALPSSDGRKVTFGRLHGLSNALLTLNALGGLMLLFWEVRERRP